jgi:hypothetical protein
MELLIIVLALVALDMLVWRFGADSRPRIENDHGRQGSHRAI